MNEEEDEPVNGSPDEPGLDELDGLLSKLPREDPPAELVARTLAAVAAEQDGAGVATDPADEVQASRRPGLSWRLVAAVLLAGFLLASVVAVGFAGRIQALFETADAALDTVDSDL